MKLNRLLQFSEVHCFGKQGKNKNIRCFLITSISFLLISCSIGGKGSNIALDTIKPPFSIENSLCKIKSNGYFKKYGLIISNFYEITDSYFFDFDNDKIKDTLVILSPINMLLPSINSECSEVKKGNRLLIIINKKRASIFENVIRNEFGSATIGTESISESKDGFTLSYYQGQACYFEYEIKVIYKNNTFFVNEIILKSGGCPGEKEKKIDFINKNLLLKNYNRASIDSLRMANEF